jgi:hypothetical protein
MNSVCTEWLIPVHRHCLNLSSTDLPVDVCKSDWRASACTSRPGITINCVCGQASRLKLLAQKKLKSQIVHCPRFYLPTLERYDILCCPMFSGCCILINFLLLGCLRQSIDLLDITICSIKCHEQINNSIQLNHFNN